MNSNEFKKAFGITDLMLSTRSYYPKKLVWRKDANTIYFLGFVYCLDVWIIWLNEITTPCRIVVNHDLNKLINEFSNYLKSCTP